MGAESSPNYLILASRVRYSAAQRTEMNGALRQKYFFSLSFCHLVP
jgi:hypothetical protein